MGSPEIIIDTSAELSVEIEQRLRAAGHGVIPLSSESQVDAASFSIVLTDPSLLAKSLRTGRPVILLAPADYQFEEQQWICPDAIVSLPLRGRELENVVELTLRRLECNSDRTLVNAVRHYALFLLNSEGVIVTWNPGAKAVCHYAPSEIIGQHFSVLYPEEDRNSGVPETELRIAASEGVADDTRWLIRRGGDRFWAEGLTAVVKNAAGHTTGFAKIIRDATERRQLEQQLERSNDELQRFAYTVSHDLQEPLRTVRSYAELLTRRYKGQLDASADEFIQFMMDAAGRMSQLLKDLLAYSQAGRPDRTVTELTPSANVLQWAIMNVDRLVKDTGASITYDPLPIVEADPTQLSQVFQNLLGNAIKYRGSEPASVHISAVRAGDMYEFSVKDNGIGVDAEYHERIFGVFKRLHGKDVPGTGIGLAICRKIIETHGGRIWIESQLGQGATIKFTLPAHD